jgi:hypothetical protein
MLDGSEIVKSILPKWRRVVSFPSAVLHVGRSVSRMCPVARVVLVFKASKSVINADRTVQGYPITDSKIAARKSLDDFLIEVGADSTPHSGRTLREHLLGTFDLLSKWQCSEIVCLAGGLHSIYGTNVFKKKTLSGSAREHVKALFGQDVERLAWLFGSLYRPFVIEHGTDFLKKSNSSSQLFDPPKLKKLRLIEAANLLEQKGSLSRWPNIRKAVIEHLNAVSIQAGKV